MQKQQKEERKERKFICPWDLAAQMYLSLLVQWALVHSSNTVQNIFPCIYHMPCLLDEGHCLPKSIHSTFEANCILKHEQGTLHISNSPSTNFNNIGNSCESNLIISVVFNS